MWLSGRLVGMSFAERFEAWPRNPDEKLDSVRQFRQRLEVSIELSDVIRMRWHVRGCPQSGLLSRTMRLFLRIFRNYALVAAAIFLLQWFPVPVLR
jgi:hypothetical protein